MSAEPAPYPPPMIVGGDQQPQVDPVDAPVVEPAPIGDPQKTEPATKPAPVKWENDSLLGCMSDMSSCCCGTFCTPCLFGQNHSKVNNDGGCCCPCFVYFLSHFLFLCGPYAACTRGKIREQNNLEGGKCGACMAHTCCSPCAVCQDAREIKYWDGKKAFVASTTTTDAPAAQKME